MRCGHFVSAVTASGLRRTSVTICVAIPNEGASAPYLVVANTGLLLIHMSTNTVRFLSINESNLVINIPYGTVLYSYQLYSTRYRYDKCLLRRTGPYVRVILSPRKEEPKNAPGGAEMSGGGRESANDRTGMR